MNDTLIGHDIVIIALPSWDGDYAKSTVELARRLATHNRVLYVDPAATWKDVAMTLLRRKNTPLARVFGLENRVRTVDGGSGTVWVLTPPVAIPANRFPAGLARDTTMRWNARRLGGSVLRTMAALGMSRPIVINALNPFYGRYLAGRFGEGLLAYYCYDEISQAPWTARHGPTDEAAFLEQVDLVITTSEALRLNRLTSHPSTYLVRNGVDYGHFEKGRAGRTPSPKSEPCVGYVGSLDSRLDYELLVELVASCPKYTFRFVGRVVEEAQVAELGAFPNVEFLGARAVHQLPGLMAPMDVCIIPFVCDEFTRSIYPLKINEYLAAAKPVVMTPFADLSEFDGLVELADSTTAFAGAVRKAMQLDSDDARSRRQRRASRNSWNHRAAELSRILRAHLAEEVV